MELRRQLTRPPDHDDEAAEPRAYSSKQVGEFFDVNPGRLNPHLGVPCIENIGMESLVAVQTMMSALNTFSGSGDVATVATGVTHIRQSDASVRVSDRESDLDGGEAVADGVDRKGAGVDRGEDSQDSCVVPEVGGTLTRNDGTGAAAGVFRRDRGTSNAGTQLAHQGSTAAVAIASLPVPKVLILVEMVQVSQNVVQTQVEVPAKLTERRLLTPRSGRGPREVGNNAVAGDARGDRAYGEVGIRVCRGTVGAEVPRSQAGGGIASSVAPRKQGAGRTTDSTADRTVHRGAAVPYGVISCGGDNGLDVARKDSRGIRACSIAVEAADSRYGDGASQAAGKAGKRVGSRGAAVNCGNDSRDDDVV
ncbi:hypothetical protein PC110_g8321 [Phytophthora cactorum]|uniref:Uncharacterized protein n=1 Tax=Phytophthora cactorum TaxID=29920 RepID=A0A329SFM0_9STRA|nr:hypothetical protein PC117_g11523 [Phytophthora cactorum]RAW35371.1 hypothetical protein PC110_g8321 [Phytophthora cactorum]